MIVFRSPSDADLDRIAARASDEEPTYRPGSDAGYRTDAWSRVLASTTSWDQARDTLGRWGAHRGAGVRVRPDSPPTEGQTVALAIHLGPAYVLAACRVTSVVDTDGEYGFTYATLPGHPESGEESFVLHREHGSVRFHIRAISKPADVVTRLGGPISRLVQRRITGRYLDLDGLG